MRLKSILKYHKKELVVDNLIAKDRHLIYHSDLICLNPIFLNKHKLFENSSKKTDSFLNNANKIYHLILFNDIILICIKEM